MNLKALKEVLNSNYPDSSKEYEIINILSKDEKIIPIIMDILERERLYKKEIYSECNLLLSQADTCLEEPKFTKTCGIQEKIYNFFKKYKDAKGVGHCFKKLDYSNRFTEDNKGPFE